MRNKQFIRDEAEHDLHGTHRHMGWSWLITGRGEGGALMQKKKKRIRNSFEHTQKQTFGVI